MFLLPRNRLFGVSVPKGACNVVQTGNRDANTIIIQNIITMDPILAGLLSGRGWGDVIQSAEDSADAVFLNMSEFDFQKEKTIAKETRRFGSWNGWLAWVQRIEYKRRTARIIAATACVPTKLDDLIELREDYTSQPHIYFATPIERDAELYKLDAQIRKQRGGTERLEKILAWEHRKALPLIHAAIRRVKSQVQALHNLPKVIAAARIANFVHERRRMFKSMFPAGIPDEAWVDYVPEFSNQKPTVWDDETFIPEVVPKVLVRTDEEKVRAYLNLRPCDSISPSTFALMLEHANADEKNGTIKGMHPTVYAKCFKPMSMRKLTPEIAGIAAGFMERGVAAVSAPETASWKYRDIGAYGDINEEDEGEDSEAEDPSEE